MSGKPCLQRESRHRHGLAGHPRGPAVQRTALAVSFSVSAPLLFPILPIYLLIVSSRAVAV